MTRDDAALIRSLLHALRHAPEQYFLELDPGGWTNIEHVALALSYARADCSDLDANGLRAFVATGFADRIEIAGSRIRARYGHSVSLAGTAVVGQPPAVLFHGTGGNSLPAISDHGLLPMGRIRVHLTSDVQYAREVACTKGNRPVVLEVATEPACKVGIAFYSATAHVWLADAVPPQFIRIPHAAVPVRKGDMAP